MPDVRRAIDLLPCTVVVAAGIWLFAVGARGQPHEFPETITVATVAAVALGAATLVAILIRRHRWAAWLSRNPATVSWVLALHTGLALSVAAALLLLLPSAAERATGWILPVLNKRWLLALYGIAILTVLVLPATLERWRTAESPSEVGQLSVPSVRVARPLRWIALAIGQVVILAFAWYLAGPPWHLDRLKNWIDWHEQMRLGGLQAIAKGYLPFIGPAAFPHGPGTQVIVYTVMRATRHFDLIGFRTGWATLHLLGTIIIATVAYWQFGLVRAAVILVLAIVYSPLTLFVTSAADGTLGGYFGWSNALRYVAPLIVVPAFVRVVAAGRPQRAALVALGAVWALGAWIAQENLTTTSTALALILVLLWSTRTISLARGAWAIGHLLVGFAGVATPILAFYASRGAAREFVFNYFVIARMVMAGWSNMWWPSQDVSSARYTYYLTLPLLMIVALSTMWRLRPLRLCSPMDSRRRNLLALVCVQLACYQTALLRSDGQHLLNTLIALPFIVVLVPTELPKCWGLRSWRAGIGGIAAVVAILVVYPAFRGALPFEWLRRLQTMAVKYRTTSAPEPTGTYEGRVAYKRVPRLLHDEPELGNAAGISMPAFLQLATEIHDLVGQRKTFVADLGRYYVADGLLYFFADLVPAPALPDRDTMRINDDMRRLTIERILAEPANFECFIGSSLDTPEARAFLEVHPRARRVEKPMSNYATLYILLVDSLRPPSPDTR